jgi:hypothetical protein
MMARLNFKLSKYSKLCKIFRQRFLTGNITLAILEQSIFIKTSIEEVFAFEQILKIWWIFGRV